MEATSNGLDVLRGHNQFFHHITAQFSLTSTQYLNCLASLFAGGTCSASLSAELWEGRTVHRRDTLERFRTIYFRRGTASEHVAMHSMYWWPQTTSCPMKTTKLTPRVSIVWRSETQSLWAPFDATFLTRFFHILSMAFMIGSLEKLMAHALQY